MSNSVPDPVPCGPVLFARGAGDGVVALRALVVRVDHESPPLLEADGGAAVTPRRAWHEDGTTGWHYDFNLPQRASTGYRIGTRHFPVAADFSPLTRIAYVSCNGRDGPDEGWPGGERDEMWQRLGQTHRREPLQLLLHGGDQIYADDVLRCHPELLRFNRANPDRQPDLALSDEAASTVSRHLRSRYTRLYAREAIGWLLARVPSIMMWDDHDIFDGWGSLPTSTLDSPIAQSLFENARRCFLRFQLGADEGAPPSICLCEDGQDLSLAARFPGFDVVAPDLRSGRRPDQVLSAPAWRRLEDTIRRDGPASRLLLMSSVPALGPRLSWIEGLAPLIPGAHEFRDDLRDQWQSRAHRGEWRRLLRTLVDESDRRAVTVLSGEIHLATRGEMTGRKRTVHQLVSSGVAHPPPPRGFARALGLLARTGNDPLPDHPIRLRGLPGQSGIYTAQRNVLLLQNDAGQWRARWDVEDDGLTPWIHL